MCSKYQTPAPLAKTMTGVSHQKRLEPLDMVARLPNGTLMLGKRESIMQTCFAYVGSYTTPDRRGRGNGIDVYRVDRRSGAFHPVQRISQLENPSFLAL